MMLSELGEEAAVVSQNIGFADDDGGGRGGVESWADVFDNVEGGEEEGAEGDVDIEV